MAVATVETIVANPARKRSPHMARRMTLKQRLHFGTKRQRAAAHASLRSHRKRNTARRKSSSRPRHRRRTENPGEIIAMTLGNPARRKTVAKPKTKRRSTSKSHRHAGRPRHYKKHRPNPGHRPRRRPSMRNRARSRSYVRHRHHNPAGYRWTDVFVLGGGALVGSTLSLAGTQMLLQSNNTGVMGYAGNLIATLILSWLGGMVTRNRAFPAGILAGGVGAIMRRIISDYSLFGGYTAQLGMGDYMVANWVTPQRLVSDFRSLTEANVGQGNWGMQTAPAALAMSSSGISARGMGLEGDSGTGNAGY
jgi:hypothetical protein